MTNRATPLTGLEIRVISREISSALRGSYVSNIYSIGESQLFRMRKPMGGGEGNGEGNPDGGQEVTLVVSPKLGAWITEKPARIETTEFTTALRGRLVRARLTGVEQYDLDRVLSLTFENRGEATRLVLEMMPPGDILLTTQDHKILVALREVRSERRRLVRGGIYQPPSQGGRASPDTLTPDGLEKALAAEKTLGRALGRGVSLPRKYVDEVLARASRRQDDPAAEVTKEEATKLLAVIKQLVAELDSPSPSLVKLGEAVEVMPFTPKRGEVVATSPSMSALIDEAFSDALANDESVLEEEDDDDRRLQEYRATIEGLKAQKQGLQKRAAEVRDLAARVRAAPGAKEAMEMATASSVVPAEKLARLSRGQQASIASAIFDEAKSIERKTLDVDAAIADLTSRLGREGGGGGDAWATRGSRAIAMPKRRTQWYEKFRWFETTAGRLAIGGRDAQSNTTLIRKHLEEGDTVYHADLFGSPFFILKGGREQSEEESREVAKATVAFSSAWKTGLGAADAYWVEPGQVATAGPSGEYLAHGSFAIKGKKNFIPKNPVELAVGIDDKGRVISGPEESVMGRALAHVTLIPHREKPSDTAKKILHELRGHSDVAAGLTVDDVLRMLPAGGGKIIRRRADRRDAR